MTRDAALQSLQQRSAALDPRRWIAVWDKVCRTAWWDRHQAVQNYQRLHPAPPERWSWDGDYEPRQLSPACVRLISERDLYHDALDELGELKRAELDFKPRWAMLTREQQEAQIAANAEFLRWSINWLMDDDND